MIPICKTIVPHQIYALWLSWEVDVIVRVLTFHPVEMGHVGFPSVSKTSNQR